MTSAALPPAPPLTPDEPAAVAPWPPLASMAIWVTAGGTVKNCAVLFSFGVKRAEVW